MHCAFFCSDVEYLTSVQIHCNQTLFLESSQPPVGTLCNDAAGGRARIHAGEPLPGAARAPRLCLPFWLEQLNAVWIRPYDPAWAAADTDPRPSAGRLSAYVTHCTDASVADLEWVGGGAARTGREKNPPLLRPNASNGPARQSTAGVGPSRDLCLGHVVEQGWRLRWRGTAVAGCEWKDATHLARWAPHTPFHTSGANGGRQTAGGKPVWVKPRCARDESRRSPLILLVQPSQATDGVVQQATLGASPDP